MSCHVLTPAVMYAISSRRKHINQIKIQNTSNFGRGEYNFAFSFAIYLQNFIRCPSLHTWWLTSLRVSLPELIEVFQVHIHLSLLSFLHRLSWLWPASVSLQCDKLHLAGNVFIAHEAEWCKENVSWCWPLPGVKGIFMKVCKSKCNVSSAGEIQYVLNIKERGVKTDLRIACLCRIYFTWLWEDHLDWYNI